MILPTFRKFSYIFIVFLTSCASNQAVVNPKSSYYETTVTVAAKNSYSDINIRVGKECFLLYDTVSKIGEKYWAHWDGQCSLQNRPTGKGTLRMFESSILGHPRVFIGTLNNGVIVSGEYQSGSTQINGFKVRTRGYLQFRKKCDVSVTKYDVKGKFAPYLSCEDVESDGRFDPQYASSALIQTMYDAYDGLAIKGIDANAVAFIEVIGPALKVAVPIMQARVDKIENDNQQKKISSLQQQENMAIKKLDFATYDKKINERLVLQNSIAQEKLRKETIAKNAAKEEKAKENARKVSAELSSNPKKTGEIVDYFDACMISLIETPKLVTQVDLSKLSKSAFADEIASRREERAEQMAEKAEKRRDRLNGEREEPPTKWICQYPATVFVCYPHNGRSSCSSGDKLKEGDVTTFLGTSVDDKENYIWSTFICPRQSEPIDRVYFDKNNNKFSVDTRCKWS